MVQLTRAGGRHALAYTENKVKNFITCRLDQSKGPSRTVSHIQIFTGIQQNMKLIALLCCFLATVGTLPRNLEIPLR